MVELDEGGFSDVDSPSLRIHSPHPRSPDAARGNERRIKWPMARLISKIYTAEIEPQQNRILTK